MDKGGVDHGVRRRGSAAQPFQVLEITPMDLGAGSAKRLAPTSLRAMPRT